MLSLGRYGHAGLVEGRPVHLFSPPTPQEMEDSCISWFPQKKEWNAGAKCIRGGLWDDPSLTLSLSLTQVLEELLVVHPREGMDDKSGPWHVFG